MQGWRVCFNEEHTFTYEGRTWCFEYSPSVGPWPLRKDGEPYKRLGEKSAFWAAFEAWLQKQEQNRHLESLALPQK